MQRFAFPLPARVALTYLVAAVAYILVSDRLLVALVPHADALTFWQTFKGIGFVTATSLLLYATLVVEERQRVRAESAHRQEQERVRLLVEHAQDFVYRYRLVAPCGFEYVSPASTALTGYTPDELYARPELLLELVDDFHRPSFEAALSGERDGPLILRWKRRDGSMIWTEQRHRLLRTDTGTVVAIEGIARDVSATKHAEEELARARDVAERAAQRADTLQAVTAALAGALTPDDVVEVIFDHGLRALHAHAAVVSVIDASGENLEIVGHSGRPREEIEKYRVLSLDLHTAPTVAVRTGQPIWIGSLEESEERFPGSREILERFGDASVAILPLMTGGRPIGGVSFSFAAQRVFDHDERGLMTNLAQQCAISLERSRLYAEVRASQLRLQALSQRVLEAQEQERRHIARELHDEVGQVLGALKINLHLLRDPALDEASRRRLEESISILDRLLQQIRALSLDLRPSVLDDQGLGEALAWFGERIGERSGLDVSIENELDDSTIPPSIANACFRIAQEALNNAVRHAQAHHLEMRFAVQDDVLDLSIRDDGIGFDVPAQQRRAVAGTSLGLISMQERATLAGGTTEITSSAGAGTQVHARFPLHSTVGTAES